MAARKKAKRGKKNPARRKKKKHGMSAKPQRKARAVILNPGGPDVWDVQKALRKDKFFARAIGPNKVLTNAPITRI